MSDEPRRDVLGLTISVVVEPPMLVGGQVGFRSHALWSGQLPPEVIVACLGAAAELAQVTRDQVQGQLDAVIAQAVGRATAEGRRQ